MTAIEDREVERCKQCNKTLLLGKTGLCICCENTFLRKELAEKDATLTKMEKSQQDLHSKLIALRKERDE